MQIRSTLAVALTVLGCAQAHRHGKRHEHHKRKDADTCACITSTVTSWIPYIPEDWATSTTTVWTTQMVYVSVETSGTLTVTVTSTPAAHRIKRDEVVEMDEHVKGTSVIPTRAQDCEEVVAETWVPYHPEPIGVVDEEIANSTAEDASQIVLETPQHSKKLNRRQGNGLYKVTYTAYDPSTGGCMTPEAVLSDLRLIKAAGFPGIRMYSVDCNQLSTVADQAIGLGLAVTLGVYIDSTGASRGNADLDAIVGWGKWEGVDIINLGNEAVFNGFMTGDEMVTFIHAGTSRLRAAGFTGIISTVETVGTYQANPQLCGAVESHIHANIHPYFDPNTSSSEAGTFVVNQQGMVESLCGLPVIVSETGWPSAGGSNTNAVASVNDQATAIASIMTATGGDVTFFSFSNDFWKSAGVEQHFGCFDLF